jgi:uracil-DNA glycosylase family 4
LYRAGLADRPTSRRADAGLTLTDVYIAAAARCAPPANKPTIDERDTCLPYFERELQLLARVQVLIALGQFAYDNLARVLGVRPRPRFGHGVEVPAGEGRTIICSFHPSQQNTFTGKLTEPMLDAVLGEAAGLAGITSTG